MPRSPQWMDLYQIWFRVSSRGRNQLCGILVTCHWSEGALVRRLWCRNTLPRSSPYTRRSKANTPLSVSQTIILVLHVSLSHTLILISTELSLLILCMSCMPCMSCNILNIIVPSSNTQVNSASP